MTTITPIDDRWPVDNILWKNLVCRHPTVSDSLYGGDVNIIPPCRRCYPHQWELFQARYVFLEIILCDNCGLDMTDRRPGLTLVDPATGRFRIMCIACEEAIPHE